MKEILAELETAAGEAETSGKEVERLQKEISVAADKHQKSVEKVRNLRVKFNQALDSRLGDFSNSGQDDRIRQSR